MITPYRILAAAGVVLFMGLFTTVGHTQTTQWQVLREDPEIHSGLTVIAVGRHIQDVCDDISPRMARALLFAEGLVGRARDLGVSRSEINAFIENRDEQRRYDAVRDAWFAQNGADAQDVASVCRVGRDEISEGSQIGRLLR